MAHGGQGSPPQGLWHGTWRMAHSPCSGCRVGANMMQIQVQVVLRLALAWLLKISVPRCP